MALQMGRSRLPELLVRAGKRQVDLAEYLEVSEPYISRVISGHDELSVFNRKRTAIFLGCRSSDDLNEWYLDGQLLDYNRL